MSKSSYDPKGLIHESYRIDGIQIGECRSIFLDWAISLPEGVETRAALTALVALYADEAPDHPMSAVLRQGLQAAPAGGRRGGRAGRLSH